MPAAAGCACNLHSTGSRASSKSWLYVHGQLLLQVTRCLRIQLNGTVVRPNHPPPHVGVPSLRHVQAPPARRPMHTAAGTRRRPGGGVEAGHEGGCAGACAAYVCMCAMNWHVPGSMSPCCMHPLQQIDLPFSSLYSTALLPTMLHEMPS